MERISRCTRPCSSVLIAALSLVAAPLSTPAHAAWIPGGNLLASGPNDQMLPHLLADGSGGVFVYWIGQGVIRPECGGQHVDATGAVLWGAGGVLVPLPFTIVANSFTPPISDQQGGAILFSALPNDIAYAQRIDGLGNSLWGDNSADLFTNPAFNVPVYAQPIAAGGTSPLTDPLGVIATWAEQVTSAGDINIYAQRLDDASNVMWGSLSSPLAVCTAAGDQTEVAICTDGTPAALGPHGAFISWLDGRTGFPDNIYINRISGDGAASWLDGIAVCSIHTAVSGPVVDSFGASSALVVWADTRRVVGTYDLYAQKVSVDGTMAWTTNGVPICEATGTRYASAMIPFGAGGELIALGDARSDVGDIYVQAIDASGNRLWGAGGLSVCTASGVQAGPQLVPDDAGGAFVIWFDRRVGHYEIYGQHIDANGNALWQANGQLLVPLNNLSINETHALADGTGGFYLTWHDKVLDPSYDVYLSRFNASGSVLAAGPAPIGDFRLELASPNPSRDGALFSVQMPTAGRLSARVLDLQGRVVRELADFERLPAGFHTLEWNGRNASGEWAGPGVYFAVAQVDGQTRTLKVVELK